LVEPEGRAHLQPPNRHGGDATEPMLTLVRARGGLELYQVHLPDEALARAVVHHTDRGGRLLERLEGREAIEGRTLVPVRIAVAVELEVEHRQREAEQAHPAR